MTESAPPAARIDLWLKHACVVRHRAEATDACKGGLVKINGRRVKPSADVRAGDLVELTEPRYRKLVVLGIPPKQASKEAARLLYRDETPEPTPEQVAVRIAMREDGSGRPTKKERREIERWKGR
jgi:ribosome-associated heat shock protein Hsp15